MHFSIVLTTVLSASLGSAQTLRKYARTGCQGAVAVCSINSGVMAQSSWPQATCCQQGVKKSGSLRISGVLANVGELSVVYKGNFKTQCSVQREVYVGSPVGCVGGQALGTGIWLSCGMRYSTPQYNNNCSNYKKKRGISAGGNETMEEDDSSSSNTTLAERPHDPDYLPSGFYDSLGNSITEGEYWTHVAWERDNGGNYAHHLQSLKQSGSQNATQKRAAGSEADLTTYTSTQCRGEETGHITTIGKCITAINSASFDVYTLAPQCTVTTYSDEECKQDAYAAIQGSRDNAGSEGCYEVDNFASIMVTC